MNNAARPQKASGKIRSVLFACNMNSIRSPMAEFLAKDILSKLIKIESCGVYEGGTDPFLPTIMEEVDIKLEGLKSTAFKTHNVADFDIIVCLTHEAALEAAKFTSQDKIEVWDIPNPTDTYGSRERMMEAYREARNILKRRIEARFCVI